MAAVNFRPDFSFAVSTFAALVFPILVLDQRGLCPPGRRRTRTWDPYVGPVTAVHAEPGQYTEHAKPPDRRRACEIGPVGILIVLVVVLGVSAGMSEAGPAGRPRSKERTPKTGVNMAAGFAFWPQLRLLQESVSHGVNGSRPQQDWLVGQGPPLWMNSVASGRSSAR